MASEHMTMSDGSLAAQSIMTFRGISNKLLTKPSLLVKCNLFIYFLS